MFEKLKKHVGILILVLILIMFPSSLTNQARLNLRIIVTGLAIDKTDDEYKVTAQIVKAQPGSESAGTGATVDFISDTSKTLSGAISKLSYKAGKVSAFSHTNYVIMGKKMLEEDVTKGLDYFMRDRIVKSSTMLIFSENEAEKEIKKTKNMELSVAIELQKIFLYKEKESDGQMVTIVDFLNKSKTFSNTATSCVLSLKSSEEDDKSESSSESTETSSNQSSSSENSDEKGSLTNYFDSKTSILCFRDGFFKGKIDEEKQIEGFMLASNKCKSANLTVKYSKDGRLKDSNVEIKIKNKSDTKNFRFEGSVPCMDLKVKLKNVEINDIESNEIVSRLSDEEYQNLIDDIKNEISTNISQCFTKTKEFNVDIFGAYEKAYKFENKKLKQYYSSPNDFISNLKLNVDVEVVKLDY